MIQCWSFCGASTGISTRPDSLLPSGELVRQRFVLQAHNEEGSKWIRDKAEYCIVMARYDLS